MKILLEQVIKGEPDTRITLVDNSMESLDHAIQLHDAIKAFDEMASAAGYFNDNDHIHLELNGVDIGYGQLETPKCVWDFAEENSL